MGREISLFSGYDQKENRTTNYCLLMLRQVYEESPRLLATVLKELIGDDVGQRVGVQFRQQERAGGSIPDGLIAQAGFMIFVETKNSDWFYWEQIERHLHGLSSAGEGLKVLIALSNFQDRDDAKFERFRQQVSDQFGAELLFAAVSFEDLLAALELTHLPPLLQSSLADFRGYLEGQGLLANWRRKLEVVNCVSTMHEIEKGAYLCPARGGSYSHARARFFGPYRWKTVDRVAEIEAVADVFAEDEQCQILWNNTSTNDTDLLQRAKSLVQEFRPDNLAEGVRVFLLGPAHSTNFAKDSKHGLRGTKVYFDVPEMEPQELAVYLNGKCWGDLR